MRAGVLYHALLCRVVPCTCASMPCTGVCCLALLYPCMQAPPALELGPSAVSSGRGPSLGDALEAGYAAARQAVRSSNGIRVLLMLLQVRCCVRWVGGVCACEGLDA
jgi:hypothetical protein